MFDAPDDLPAAVLGFVGVHLALRAEMTHIARAVDTGDEVTAARRARLFGRVLHHHHTAEDQLLWPALVGRHPGMSPVTADLEAQHLELDLRLAALPDRLEDVTGVRRLVEDHLVAEEQQVLPAWLDAFSADEHDEFAAQLRRATPWRDAGLMLAWLIDHTHQSAARHAWSEVPRPLRVAHHLWWRPRYERHWGRVGADTSGSSLSLAIT
jgi:hypothetical protein